ncbi:MAG: DUF4369 domain-containing protein [Bacteroidota bacterium]
MFNLLSPIMKNLKSIFTLLIISLFIISCETDTTKKDEKNFFLTGKVDGIRKGKLLLQKVEDTAFTTIDSTVFDGDDQVKLEAYLDEPEALFLRLHKHGGETYEDVISFFAEKGDFELVSKLSNFQQAKVVGESENLQKYEEFKKMMKRFNDKNLDFIAENLQQIDDNNEAAEEKYYTLLKRKYLYTINFALKNKDLEVAPYVMVSEAFAANTKYLDTVYNSLNKKVKKSKYAKNLEELIEARKDKNQEEQIEVETIETKSIDSDSVEAKNDAV